MKKLGIKHHKIQPRTPQHNGKVERSVWKWTLEMTSGTSNPCASREGDYFDSGSNCPASKCYGSKTNGNYYSFGFRPTFYVN